MKRGVWYAAGAYTIWGLLPLYWHALRALPALELISHRLVWSFVLVTAIILVTRSFREFRSAIAAPRVLAIYTLAALLVGVNWFVYVWAVNAGFVVETSLGYFINPLISVTLGVVFLHERLRPVQWLAIAVAAAGVSFLAWTHGSLPWIALTLAITFALYGLVKKLAPLNSVQGLTLETGILFLPAAAYLTVMQSTHGGVFLDGSATGILLVAGTGVATTVPLLLFASASRRIPLLWLGLLQYIAPTLQFVLGVFVFGEAMTVERLIGFAAVWLALAIFGVEGIVNSRAAAFPPTTD